MIRWYSSITDRVVGLITAAYEHEWCRVWRRCCFSLQHEDQPARSRPYVMKQHKNLTTAKEPTSIFFCCVFLSSTALPCKGVEGIVGLGLCHIRSRGKISPVLSIVRLQPHSRQQPHLDFRVGEMSPVSSFCCLTLLHTRETLNRQTVIRRSHPFQRLFLP